MHGQLTPLVPLSLARPQERLQLLLAERTKLINENWQPGQAAAKPVLKRKDSNNQGSSMVEKERQRLEVLKRRQERELQQMVQYEVARKVRGAGALAPRRARGARGEAG